MVDVHEDLFPCQLHPSTPMAAVRHFHAVIASKQYPCLFCSIRGKMYVCMCLVVVVFYSFVHKSKEQSYLLWHPCLHFHSLCGEKNSCTQKKIRNGCLLLYFKNICWNDI